MTIKGKSAHPAVRRNQEDLLLIVEYCHDFRLHIS